MANISTPPVEPATSEANPTLFLNGVIKKTTAVLEHAVTDLVAAGVSALADSDGKVRVDSRLARRVLDSLNEEFLRLRKL